MTQYSSPAITETREQRKNVQKLWAGLSRNEARRAIIDLLWARLFSEAAFLSRIFWKHDVITPDDYQFLLNILVLAKNGDSRDLAWN
jgi:hypothetical protein